MMYVSTVMCHTAKSRARLTISGVLSQDIKYKCIDAVDAPTFDLYVRTSSESHISIQVEDVVAFYFSRSLHFSECIDFIHESRVAGGNVLIHWYVSISQRIRAVESRYNRQ